MNDDGGGGVVGDGDDGLEDAERWNKRHAAIASKALRAVRWGRMNRRYFERDVAYDNDRTRARANERVFAAARDGQRGRLEELSQQGRKGFENARERLQRKWVYSASSRDERARAGRTLGAHEAWRDAGGERRYAKTSEDGVLREAEAVLRYERRGIKEAIVQVVQAEDFVEDDVPSEEDDPRSAIDIIAEAVRAASAKDWLTAPIPEYDKAFVKKALRGMSAREGTECYGWYDSPTPRKAVHLRLMASFALRMSDENLHRAKALANASTRERERVRGEYTKYLALATLKGVLPPDWSSDDCHESMAWALKNDYLFQLVTEEKIDSMFEPRAEVLRLRVLAERIIGAHGKWIFETLFSNLVTVKLYEIQRAQGEFNGEPAKRISFAYPWGPDHRPTDRPVGFVDEPGPYLGFTTKDFAKIYARHASALKIAVCEALKCDPAKLEAEWRNFYDSVRF